MTSQRSLGPAATKPLANVVADSAYRFGLSMSLVISFILTVVSTFLYTKFSQERMTATLHGVEKSIAQSVALGDIYEITKQFNSLVEGGSVAGLWLYEADTRRLLHAQNSFADFVLEPTGFRPFLLAGTRLIIADQRDIRSQDGRILASLLSFTTIPLSNYLLVGVFISIVLVISTFVMARRFSTLCQRISAPIIEFSEYLARRRSIEETEPIPSTFPYVEMERLYQSHLEMAAHLLKAQKMEKDAAIGRITAQLSHDMRAPLGAFERIMQNPQEDFQKTRGALKNALNRLYAMVDSLRFSETENLVSRRRSDLDLALVLESFQTQASSRSIQLILPAEQYPSVWIDPPKMERAISNLVSNALDFARSSVKVEIAAADGGLTIRVTDDGPGVPPEFANQLFLRGATHGKADGSGLGLAYVRQVMRGHGGDVTYRREAGLSIFECHLPGAVDQVLEPETLRVPDTAEADETWQKRTVAICIVPPELSQAVLLGLAGFATEALSFSEDGRDADAVVSNSPKLMVEVLERDQEYVSVAAVKAEADAIVAFLVRKFSLHER